MNFELFVKERNAALLSLDEKRIKSVMKKYGLWIPPSEEGFWRGVHKAICNITEFPPEVRKKSEDWLLEHGSTTEIFGKVMEGGRSNA